MGTSMNFAPKMKFPAQKNKNTSVNGTTSLAVIVGPKCLIAHLLAPHDRAFSLYSKATRLSRPRTKPLQWSWPRLPRRC